MLFQVVEEALDHFLWPTEVGNWSPFNLVESLNEIRTDFSSSTQKESKRRSYRKRYQIHSNLSHESFHVNKKQRCDVSQSERKFILCSSTVIVAKRWWDNEQLNLHVSSLLRQSYSRYTYDLHCEPSRWRILIVWSFQSYGNVSVQNVHTISVCPGTSECLCVRIN